MKLDVQDDFDLPYLVDSIIAAYLDALDRGQAQREDWLASYPEQAQELARFLDDLDSFSPGKTPATETSWVEGQADPTHSNSLTPPLESPGSSRSGGMFPPGHQFGEYELLEMVARGGMGIVFKARQGKLARLVALKMILTGQLASAQDIQRFRTEAQAAARLDHPGIVPVYEVGEHHGLHYFTMAFIEGTSLAERLRDGPLAPKLAAHLLRAIAGAIHYAHQHGIIHRDLKPANILIDQQGQPKLTDFGLAKRIDDASDMTGTGQILGTPTYMSPEQAQGVSRDIGPASDIYGLGALLFALLTGRPPFQAATPLETIQHVLLVEPPQPRALNPSVPRDLETICLKCLEKSPGKRYATAAALAEDLDRYLNDHPIQARPAGMIEKAYRWYRRRPVIGTMATALAILLVAVPVLLAGLWQEAAARADGEATAHQKEAVAHKNEADAHQKEAAARRKIEALERERTQQLFQAYVKEATARRTSPRVGRRFEAIDRLVAARELADELKLPNEDYVRLRSEAISTLSLTDLRSTATGPGWALRAFPDPSLFRHASGTDCYLDWDKPNGLLLRRIGNNSIVQRIPDLTRDATQYHDFPQISPDNRFVSQVSNFTLVVWQVDGDKPKEVVRRAEVYAVGFPHAGRGATDPVAILLTRQREIVIQPLDGKGPPKVLRLPEIQKEQQLLHSYDLAVANRQAAVAGTNRVSIVDLDAGKVTAVCPLPGLVDHLAWSPDGATLAIACREDSIVLYQPASKSRRVVKGPLGGALFVDFDPSGRYLLSISVWGKRGILWNVAQRSAEFRFSASELLAPGPAHAGPQLAGWWQAALDSAHHVITSLNSENGKAGPLGYSAVHPGGRLLANHTSDGIVLGDLATGQPLGSLPSEKGGSLRFDSSGNLYGYINEQLHRWPITTVGNRFKIGLPELLNLPTIPSNFDISSDGRFVVQSLFAGSILLDRQTGKTTRFQPQEDVRHVAIHPNGSLVASFSWSVKGFRLWESKTGKLIHGHDQGTTGRGRFTPDGKYLITTASGIPDILLWSVPDGKLVRKLGSTAEFAISPDNRYLAAAEGAGKVRLSRIDNGDSIARFDAPGEDYLADIQFSADGRYLFGLNLEQTKYHVWDLWKLRRQLGELKLNWESMPAPEATTVRASIVVEIVKSKLKVPPAKKPS